MPIIFRIIHVLASQSVSTVQVTVSWRTFLSTINPITTNFDVYTGATILPASSTRRAAVQPHGRLDEGGCNKETIGYMEYFHVDVVNLPLELASSRDGTDMRMTHLRYWVKGVSRMGSRLLIFKVLETPLKGGDTNDTNSSDIGTWSAESRTAQEFWACRSSKHAEGIFVPNGRVSGVQ